MSSVISKSLAIAESTVEQYCTADGLSLNAGGYAIRLYLNGGKTGYAILNDAAKEVLYPTATAKPIKADSQIRGSRSAGTMSVNLQFDSVNVHSVSFSSTSLKTILSEGITDSAVTTSTRSTEIKWQVNGSSTVSNFRVSTTDLTLYFNQYSMSANLGDGANGVRSVSPSSSVSYDGDTITFTSDLYNGASWGGWYSDSACTQLVSSDRNYSVAPSSDITLYAKATLEQALYNCSAVAGSEISSVTVSESAVVDGDTCTFTAVANEGCDFNGWYSDSACTALVSTLNPYTATITANTTLYAKATRRILNVSVGDAEHGVATVNSTSIPYGSEVAFTFTPENENWELYGWYKDAALTELVSEENPYTFAITEDTNFYVKTGKKRYTITFGRDRSFLYGSKFDLVAISLYFDKLTHEEKAFLRSGDYDNIDPVKVFERGEINGDNEFSAYWASIKCPCDAAVAVYSRRIDPTLGTSSVKYSWITDGDGNTLTYWPYYWVQPTGDIKLSSMSKGEEYWCICSAIAKDGIDYAYVTTPTYQEREAIFEAELLPNYIFSGWYSDEDCTTLVSADNPAYVATPKYTTDSASTTMLTLYAKAELDRSVTLSVSVAETEHGTASVNATSVLCGDSVTAAFTPENEQWQLYGWYADSDLTTLLSEDNPYTFTVTDNVVLYPKVGLKPYTITLSCDCSSVGGNWALLAGILNFDELSEGERYNAFNYDGMNSLTCAALGYDPSLLGYSPSKWYFSTKEYLSPSSTSGTVSAEVPPGMYVALWVSPNNSSSDDSSSSLSYAAYISDTDYLSYYVYCPTQDADFTVMWDTAGYCICRASAATEGVIGLKVPPIVIAGKDATFTAELASGYSFNGWYSDEACTELISNCNPALVTTLTPDYNADGSWSDTPELLLYAAAQPLPKSANGMYLKVSGSYIPTDNVYIKIDGEWIKDSDACKSYLAEADMVRVVYI